MGRFAFPAMVFTTALLLVLPLVGGGPGLAVSVAENSGSTASSSTSITGPQASQEVDRWTTVSVTSAPPRESAQGATTPVDGATDAAASAVEPAAVATADVAATDFAGAAAVAVGSATAPGAVQSGGAGCPTLGAVSVGSAPSATSAGGVAGTTTDDLVVFAGQFNALRVANCLQPITKIVYDSCMEQRLFWMAESPSPDPLDAWGHIGSTRIDGVPSVGCDGNLAGGSGNTGATAAQKWWDSLSHRASLYRPGSSVAGVCIGLSVTHGGNGEPYSFVRAAARWLTSC